MATAKSIGAAARSSSPAAAVIAHAAANSSPTPARPVERRRPRITRSAGSWAPST